MESKAHRASQREPFRNKFVMSCKPKLPSISSCGERVGGHLELTNQRRNRHQAPRPTGVEVLVRAHEASASTGAKQGGLDALSWRNCRRIGNGRFVQKSQAAKLCVLCVLCVLCALCVLCIPLWCVLLDR